MTTDRYDTWDAAYVFGALSTDERAEYEEHLAVCETCRAAVNELAGLPGILGRLDRDTALAITEEAPVDTAPRPMPQHDLVPRLSRRTARRRRAARALAAAAVVLGVLCGVLAGVLVPRIGAGGRAVDLASVDRTAVTGHLTATPAAWGTRLDWSCSYGSAAAAERYAGARYELTVTTTDGRTRDVATWAAAGRTSTGLAASVAVPVTTIRSVAIRSADGGALAAASL